MTIEFEKLFSSDEDRRDLCVGMTILKVTELLCGMLERHNMTRSELARIMDVSPGRITQILDGDANLTLKSIARAMAAFGMVLDVNAVPLDGLTRRWEPSDVFTNLNEQNNALPSVPERNFALAA